MPIILILVGILAVLSAVAVGLPSAKGPRAAQFSGAKKCKRAHRHMRESRLARTRGCSAGHSGKGSRRCKKGGQRKHCPGKKAGSGKGKPKSTKPTQPGSSPAQPSPAPTQPAPGGESPPPDLTPPDTAIDSGPPEGVTLYEGSASFVFSSPDDDAATFECSLDSAAFSACQSPIDYARLGTGDHSFKVRAVDAVGNRDPSPASRGFKVDLTRSDTTITARPPQTVVPDSTQELRFESDDPGSTFECRLGTSAFAPCSSPWSVSVNAPGDYSGEVRAIGSNGQPDPTPAGFTITAAEPEQRCGTLAHDETWSTDNLSGIVLNCSVNVPAGIKLEIDAGVFVKFEGSEGIEVSGGTLQANGTAAEPVVFTSIRDDSAGGDTNGDGSASSPSPGNWWGINVGGGGSVDLHHASLRWATTAVDGPSDEVAGFSIIDSSVSGSSSTGIDLSGSTAAPVVTGNTVSGSGGPAMQLHSQHLDASKLGGNSGSGNHGGMQLAGTFDGSGTLDDAGLPPQPGTNNGYDLTIAAGTTVTLPAGTVWKGNEFGRSLYVHGTLQANGTAAEPVVFTSIRDDSAGGDTNGDGSASSPSPGNWWGINVGGGGSVDLHHASLRWATTAVDGPSDEVAGFSIIDSSVSGSSSTGIDLSGSTAAPVVTGNTVSGSGGPAMQLHSQHLDASKLGGNSGSGNHGGMQLAGTFDGSGTLDDAGLPPQPGTNNGYDLTIAAGTTVTLPAGTVWKGNEFGRSLYVHGTLQANGTAAEPVVFTSIRDDSAGGDTNGDGSASSPSPGNWWGINVGGGGSVDLHHASLRWATTAVDGPSDEVAGFSIIDSSVSGSSSTGIDLSGSTAAPVVTGNTVSGSGGPAMQLHSQHLDASKLGGNSGSGNHGGMQLAGTFDGSGTLDDAGLPPQPGTNNGYDLTIAAGTTVTLPAGTVWKGNEFGRSLYVHGTLQANGTAAEPVVFTSIRDDSAGGDTNGDGSASSPSPGNWWGINVGGGGSVDLHHASLRWATTAVDGPSDEVAGFSIIDSSVSGSSSTGIDLSGSTAAPVVTGNTVSGSGGPAMQLHSQHLDASKLGGNSGSGNHGGMQLAGTFDGSGTLDDAGLPPQPGTNNGYDLTIAAGTTVTLPAGTVWKGNEFGRSLYVHGTLQANGTAAEPVVFTSIRDDSAGGDTNGDGSASSPSPGNWWGINVEGPESSLDLEHSRVEYAGIAVSFDGEVGRLNKVDILHSSLALGAYAGTVSLRGSVQDVSAGIEACSWESGKCSVDAAYTYWGSSEGPFPSGEPGLACGAVTTSPYLIEASGGTESGSVFGSTDCGGSSSPGQQLTAAQQASNESLAEHQIECGEELEEACAWIEAYENCLGAATSLAQSQSPFPFSDPAEVASVGGDFLQTSENITVSTLGQVTSFGLGLVHVVQTFFALSDAYNSCP